MKICSKCSIEKDYSHFHKNVRMKDGYYSVCKCCRLGHEPRMKLYELKEKLCTGCGETKDIDKFGYQNKSKCNSRTTKCYSCMSKDKYNKQADASLYNRIKRLRKLYRIELSDYKKMYDAQGGVCKICKESDGKILNVDHCHSSGQVRGLLCNRCNKGIGNLRDNVKYLKSAIDYILSSSQIKLDI